MASTRTPRAPRRRLDVEQLETREVLSGVQPTALAQLMLEEINNARENPAAYGASIGLNLSGVSPSQPLAWNTQLVQSALLHSQDMNANNYFGHVSPGGQDEGSRLTSLGFPWTSYAESIAAGFTTPASALQALIIDNGVSDLGHRRDLLAIDPVYKSLNLVGIGIVTGGSGAYQNYYTIDTGSTASTQPYLTGVVYNDLNHNGQYDLNEGLGGVLVSVKGGPSTTTFASGGYSLQLNPGSYTVTFSGGGLSQAVTTTITVGQINYRLNVTTTGVVVSYGTLGGGQTTGTPAGSTGSQGSGGAQTGQGSTPAAAANYTAWVQQLNQTLVHGALTTAQVNSYVSQLQHGTAPATVVNSIVSSAAYVQLQDQVWVTQTGQAILGKPLTTAQVTQWTTYLVHGGSQSGVVLSLMNSTYGGLSAGAWMNKLAQGLLGRTLSTVEYNAWVAYLQEGGSRQVAVTTFLTNSQYTSVADYNWVSYAAQSILGQALSSADIYNYVFLLEQGRSKASVLDALLASAAFTTADNVKL